VLVLFHLNRRVCAFDSTFHGEELRINFLAKSLGETFFNIEVVSFRRDLLLGDFVG
jgi:hypothetical protein